MPLGLFFYWSQQEIFPVAFMDSILDTLPDSPGHYNGKDPSQPILSGC